MKCAEDRWPGTEEYLSGFIEKARRHRIPLSGSIEVTYGCNLRCVHCYLGPRSEKVDSVADEMGTARMLEIIDEITDAGCLYLLLTGGEPLLRKDFPEIYRYAKEKGLLLTIFTNGTLVTEEITSLFREYPPHEVEISIYGATAPTYERITGVRGSFEKCMSGICGLIDSRVKVSLKTILMTLNLDELENMKHIAASLGARFRFDAAISPCIGGDRSPLELRISPENAIAVELSDNGRILKWKKFFENSKDSVLAEELYCCGAGVTSFNIDPKGYLQPCIMVSDVQYDMSAVGFSQCWSDMTSRLKSKKADPGFACRNCGKINLCGYCPAFFRLEKGAENVRSEYICKMGDLRYQHIVEYGLEGDSYEQGRRKDQQTDV